jgi:hypothetical protein
MRRQTGRRAGGAQPYRVTRFRRQQESSMQQTALRKDDASGEETHGAADPGTRPVEVSTKRIHELITTIDDQVRQEWTHTRDTFDGLMRAFQAKGEAIEQQVIAYTAEGEQLMQASTVVRECADNLKAELGQRLPPSVTAIRPRGGA